LRAVVSRAIYCTRATRCSFCAVINCMLSNVMENIHEAKMLRA